MGVQEGEDLQNHSEPWLGAGPRSQALLSRPDLAFFPMGSPQGTPRAEAGAWGMVVGGALGWGPSAPVDRLAPLCLGPAALPI